MSTEILEHHFFKSIPNTRSPASCKKKQILSFIRSIEQEIQQS